MKAKKEGQKPEFLSWNIGILKESFKRITIKDALLILILDALFYLLSGYFILFWLKRINEKMNSVYLPFDLASAGVEKMQQAAKDAQSFYYILILSFILLVAAIIFLSSLFKGMIWAKTTKTRITSRLLSKFLLLNFVWLASWIVIIFLISWLVQAESARTFLFGALLLSIYSTNLAYAFFMRDHTIKSLAKAIKLGFAKIHLLLLPFILIIGLFFVALLAGSLLKIDYYSLYAITKAYSFLGFEFTNSLAGMSAPEADFLIVTLISMLASPLALISAAFSRYYFSGLVDNLRGK